MEEEEKEIPGEEEELIPEYLREASPFRNQEMGIPIREGRQMVKRRGGGPWCCALGLSRGFRRGSMLKSAMVDAGESNLAFLEDPKAKKI